MDVVRYTLKTFLIILTILAIHFCFGQRPTTYGFKLLRPKRYAKLTYAVKAKEFHKAMSFRDSTISTFQTTKRADWIVPVGSRDRPEFELFAGRFKFNL